MNWKPSGVVVVRIRRLSVFLSVEDLVIVLVLDEIEVTLLGIGILGSLEVFKII